MLARTRFRARAKTWGCFLFAQEAHGVFEALQREWVHAAPHQLLDDVNTLTVLPDALGLGVDPSVFCERLREAL